MIVIFVRICNDYKPTDPTDAQRHRAEVERLIRDIVCVAWQQAAKMLAGTTHVTTFTEMEPERGLQE